MKIGSEEHKQWWKEIQLYFRWIDHYTNEFNEHPTPFINKYKKKTAYRIIKVCGIDMIEEVKGFTVES